MASNLLDKQQICSTTVYSVFVFRSQPGGTDSKSGQHIGNRVTGTAIELVSIHRKGRECNGSGRQRQDGQPRGSWGIGRERGSLNKDLCDQQELARSGRGDIIFVYHWQTNDLLPGQKSRSLLLQSEMFYFLVQYVKRFYLLKNTKIGFLETICLYNFSRN